MTIAACRLSVLAAVLASAACNSSPTMSTPLDHVGASVSGTWTQGGGTLTWTLVQAGVNVSGGSSFSQENNVFLGSVSGGGIVLGAVAADVFTFDDTYARLSQPNCAMETTGQLKVNGNSMTGTYTENDICNGVRVGQISGTLTMQKK